MLDAALSLANEFKFEIWGIIGGFITEAVKWFFKREDVSTLTTQIRNKRVYWSLTVGMALSAALLVYAHRHGGAVFTIWLALNIGVTTPMTWKLLAETTPNPSNVGGGGQGPNTSSNTIVLPPP